MSRTLVQRYWAAQDPFDPAALGAVRHPHWSADWPQSDERIPTHDADVAIHTSFPNYPAHSLARLGGSDEVWKPVPASLMFIPVRISGASDFWIAEANLEYPEDGLWHAIALLELREGLVWRETVYFCRAFDSGPWPASYPEAVPTPLPGIASSMEHDPEAERRHREAHERYLELLTSDPSAAVAHLFHDAAVVDRPQAGRRVAGLAGITHVHEEQRAVLPGEVRRVVATGNVVVTESRLSHEEGDWFLVSILEFTGDKVTKATEYLAECFAAPGWRSEWVERSPASDA
jgi:SnoaL-like protein